MGTDTKAKITSNPGADEIIGFLKKSDKIANVEIISHTPEKIIPYTNAEGVTKDIVHEAITWIGIDYLNTSGEIEGRNLVCMENVADRSIESSLPPFIENNKKYTYLSLGATGSSVEIMELIAGEFGGYVIANDCADYESPDFFHFVNGQGTYSMSAEEKKFMQALGDMGGSDKYTLLNLVSKNEEAIFDYLKSKQSLNS